MDAHPDAGAAGVRMLQGNGSDAKESRRGLPSPMVAFYKMAGLCSRYPQSRRFGHYYMGYLPWSEPAQIEVVSGAYCLLRREVLDKVGLLDEDYFMYGEDIDLSYRIFKGGYHNYYLPEKILHYKGESTHKSSFRYVHVFYDAMLIFLRKHYGHVSFLLALPIKAAVYMKAALASPTMCTGAPPTTCSLAARTPLPTCASRLASEDSVPPFSLPTAAAAPTGIFPIPTFSANSAQWQWSTTPMPIPMNRYLPSSAPSPRTKCS